MALFTSVPQKPISRRRFLKTAMMGAAGLAVYSTAIERHWLETTHLEVALADLPQVFGGMRIAQLSDIHLDEYTEPFFLRHIIDRINLLQADMVLLTGDYVSFGLSSVKFAVGAAWQCANILNGLECKSVYAVLGNHDVAVGPREVTEALKDNGIQVLTNTCLPIERAGSRFWLAGLDDPVKGVPDPDLAIPAAIRNVLHEPVVLMCHAPDYVDILQTHPAGRAVDFMLSGHTHGGQVRLPVIGALELPAMGRKYIEGLFRLGRMQLYVNRGVGTVGVPFRLLCPPEITLFTLRAN
ncbi:MAG: metallophosphoesterase [Terracidiphilus sp.]